MNRIEHENGAVVEDAGATPAEPVVVVEDPPSRDDGPTTLQKVGATVAQLAIALLILLAGVGLTYFLVSTKSAPGKLPAASAAPVVAVIEASVGTAETAVTGFGRVRAANELRVVPQVGGRVVEAHPELRAGGRIPAGAVLLRIDPADYEVALERARADLERAEAARTRVDARRRAAAAEVARRETALETMRAEAAVSRAEFENLNPGRDVPPLIAKEPQLRENEAALESALASLQDVDAEEQELDAQVRQAEAGVRAAELSLGRTDVVLPDAGDARAYRVAEELVDVGQSVVQGQPVATLYDAGSLEVPVPLEDEELRYVRVPGSPATVTLDGGRTVAGTIDRTEATIDDRSQLVEVVVALADGVDRPPTPGRFVDVAIDAEPIEGVAAIPRRALRVTPDGTPRVWLAAGDGTIEFRDVEVARRDGDAAYVRGLADGDRVITSRLDVATPGMAVQVGEVNP